MSPSWKPEGPCGGGDPIREGRSHTRRAIPYEKQEGARPRVRRDPHLAARLTSFAMAFAVRPIVTGDLDEWIALWTAYLDFYRETLDDQVKRRTFE